MRPWTFALGSVLVGLLSATALWMIAGRSRLLADDRPTSNAYKEAFASGRAEADKEIAAGAPTIFQYGLVTALSSLDKETGVPYKPIAGCLVSDEILGRAAGHNERILELLKQRGKLPGSFKPWMDKLANLKEFFEAQAKAEPPLTLTPGGPPVTAPDGKTTLRLLTETIPTQDGKGLTSLSIEVRPGGAPVGHGPTMFGPGTETKVSLVFGPKDSGFAVFRGSPSENLFAIDLRRGALLWVQ